MCFSGDVLFAGSIGRTDLPGGDHDQLLESIEEAAAATRRTQVLPGHGPQTSIGRERATNPFLLGIGTEKKDDSDCERRVSGTTRYPGLLSARLGGISVASATRWPTPPAVPGTGTSNCRSSRTPDCSRVASVNPPTW